MQGESLFITDIYQHEYFDVDNHVLRPLSKCVGVQKGHLSTYGRGKMLSSEV